MFAPGYGREDSGYGHAGTDGFGKFAAAEHHGVAVEDVDGHTGKGYGQIVEADGVLVADAEAVEEVERIKLQKLLDKCNTEIEHIQARVNNPKFTKRAPAAVLEEHKRRLTEWESKQKQTQEALDRLK